VWRVLQSHGLGAQRITAIAVLTVVVLVLYFIFPRAHVDAVATILALGVGIPALLLSIKLVLEAKTASEAARDAALITARGLESLEAYRRTFIAIEDLDRLKSSLIKQKWQESRAELSSILSQLRSIIHGGLDLNESDAEGLAAAIKAFEIVEGRLADAILKEQEPQNASGLFRSIIKHLGFLSAFSGRLRKMTKKDDNYDG
jgi:hypothetical protein